LSKVNVRRRPLWLHEQVSCPNLRSQSNGLFGYEISVFVLADPIRPLRHPIELRTAAKKRPLGRISDCRHADNRIRKDHPLTIAQTSSATPRPKERYRFFPAVYLIEIWFGHPFTLPLARQIDTFHDLPGRARGHDSSFPPLRDQVLDPHPIKAHLRS